MIIVKCLGELRNEQCSNGIIKPILTFKYIFKDLFNDVGFWQYGHHWQVAKINISKDASAP